MVERLRPDELAAFKAAFDTFDRNADGTITTKELHAAMRSGGQNPTESEVGFDQLLLQLHTSLLRATGAGYDQYSRRGRERLPGVSGVLHSHAQENQRHG